MMCIRLVAFCLEPTHSPEKLLVLLYGAAKRIVALPSIIHRESVSKRAWRWRGACIRITIITIIAKWQAVNAG